MKKRAITEAILKSLFLLLLFLPLAASPDSEAQNYFQQGNSAEAKKAKDQAGKLDSQYCAGE